jgi:selenide,water dikinase
MTDDLGEDVRRTTHNGFADDRRPKTDDAFSVHALTDITGFGLIGHLREMLLASENVAAEIHASRIPLLDGAMDCVRSRYIPGGLNANRDFAECVVTYEDLVPDDLRTLMFDPQTAGGLLVAIAPNTAASLVEALKRCGVPAQEIGQFTPAQEKLIHLVW